MNNKQIEFVKKVYPAAERLAKAGGVSPLFVTAQAALETGWEIRGIGNNIFGITKGSWTGDVSLELTTEVQISRVSPFPCIPDRGRVPRRSLGAAEETDVRRCVALPG